MDSTLKNTIDYNYQKEDLFFNTKISAFEDLSKTGNERFEYIYPESVLEKNIFMSEKAGILDFKSELMIRNYDVNIQTDVISNQINWVSNSWINNFGLENEILGMLKNTNYNVKNAIRFKTDRNVSEFYGALGFRSELGLYKYSNNNQINIFKPKLLLKLSPNDSRDISENPTNLSSSNLFELNKINNIEEVDTGSSLSLGFDYKINSLNEKKEVNGEKFKFSLGQMISAVENKDLPPASTLSEKLSDVVGEVAINFNENIKLSNNFLIDQNLENFNKNKIDLDMVYPKTSFNISYLEEREHIGNQKYLNTSAEFNTNNGQFSFGVKRNLLTNSAEFYDLSYEYINDCLRAGVAFRREFYRDRDLEPEDSLMFKITFSPLGTIATPNSQKND